MKLIALVFVLLLLQPASLSNPVEAPGKRIVREAQEYLGALEALGWSGSVLIERKNKVLLERGFGLADRAGGVACDANTLYEIASATKPFTATAIMCLVADRKVSLKDSISKHLPGVPRARREITIEHLLTHTSGIPRSAACVLDSDLQTAVESYFSTQPVAKPGSVHEYWNGGYALLAGIVEQVSGQSYMGFCRERILERANMHSSGFVGEDLPLGNQALGYTKLYSRRAAVPPYKGGYGWQYKGMGGLVTTAGDLLAFTKAIESGAIVKKKHVVNMWRPRKKLYGLGWTIAKNTPTGGRRIGHGGDVAGFHTSYQFYPDDESTIVVLVNSELLPAWKVLWDLEAIVFGRPPVNVRLPKVLKRSIKPIAGLVGIYRGAHGTEFSVGLRGTGLELRARNPRSRAVLSGLEYTEQQVRVERRVLEIMQAMIDGDSDRLTTFVAERYKAYLATSLIGNQWPAHLDRHGPLESFRLASIKEIGEGQYFFRILLQHSKRAVWATGSLQYERLVGYELESKAMTPPTSMGFLRTGKTIFQDHDLKDDSTRIQLRVQTKSGKATGIQLRIKNGITLDCTRVN